MHDNIWLIIGYGFGSIPFGLVLCYIAGYGDIRKLGSGNIGTTNVLRNTNKLLAFLTLVLDAGKGLIATLICLYLTNDIILSAWVGVLSVIGHNFPVWLRFKGGKGVATTIGTLLAITPITGLFVIVCWLTISKILKISSLSALIALFLAPIFTYNFGLQQITLQVAVLTILVFVGHKENIKRIINGTEPKIGKK